jgi:hypothetical protein
MRHKVSVALSSACRWIGASFREPSNFPLHLTWACTLLLALFAYYAWVEARNGTAAIQGQLNIMKDEQRPWAKIDIRTADFPPFDPTGVPAIPILPVITNVGHSPLFGAKIRSWAFLPGISGEDFFASWKKDCDKFRKEDRSDRWDQGAFLFPEEYFTGGTPLVGPLMPGIGRDILNSVKAGKDGRRVVAIYVYGCVNYSFTGTGEVHQTRFLVRMIRNHSAGAQTSRDSVFDLSEMVQPNEIMFIPGPGGGRDAD